MGDVTRPGLGSGVRVKAQKSGIRHQAGRAANHIRAAARSPLENFVKKTSFCGFVVQREVPAWRQPGLGIPIRSLGLPRIFRAGRARRHA
jgi:hypothetical protein